MLRSPHRPAQLWSLKPHRVEVSSEVATEEPDVDAVVGGRTALSVALRVRRKMAWDAPAMKAPGVPEADRLLRGTYRKGWEIV